MRATMRCLSIAAPSRRDNKSPEVETSAQVVLLGDNGSPMGWRPSGSIEVFMKPAAETSGGILWWRWCGGGGDERGGDAALALGRASSRGHLLQEVFRDELNIRRARMDGSSASSKKSKKKDKKAAAAVEEEDKLMRKPQRLPRRTNMTTRTRL